MRVSSRLLLSPSMVTAFTAVTIAIMLLATNFIVIANAQQQQLQSTSDGGGLTAAINGDSFTTGETITISGSVAQLGSSSNVVIEITDPQGQLVKRGFPALSATDSTFTYSFIAGEQEQFDTNAPMVASGNYLVKVRYFPPSDGIVIEEVELSFGYTADGTNTADSSGTTNSSVEAAQTSSAATAVPVTTTTTSQQAPIQDARTMSPTATMASSTFFQSTNDSFSIQVPQGWQIQDLNNSGSILSEEAAQGYGILAQLCTDVEEEEEEEPLTLTNTTNIEGCMGAHEVIHIVRYPNLDSGIIQAANNFTSATTGTTFNSN